MIRFMKELYGFYLFYRAQRRLRSALPAVFDQLDAKLPAFASKGTPRQAEQLISRSLQKATGKKPSKLDVSTVIRLYSPIEAIRNRPKGEA